MVIFVDFCALCIDTLSGSRAKCLKTSAKIALFGDDSGVSKKLAEFGQLVVHQSQISDAVTLEHVLRSEHDLASSTNSVLSRLREASDAGRMLLEEKPKEIRIELTETHDDVKTTKTGTDALVNNLNERTAEEESLDLVEKICSKLGLSLDAQEAPIQELEQMRSKCFASTNAWLKEVDIYQQWIDLKSNALRLLLLNATNGAGKSHLLSVIYGELRKKYCLGDSSPSIVSITCYNLKANSKPSRESSTKDSRPAINMIQLIAAQIATQDKTCAKNLVLHLDEKDQLVARNVSVGDLRKDLLPPPNMKGPSNVAFVLLDGIEELPSDEAAQLIDALLLVELTELRIALTSTSELLKDSLARLDRGPSSISRIDIAEHNQEDIRQSIESEVKVAKVLLEESTGLSRITTSMRQKLPQIVKGNFKDAEQIIERIAQAVKEDQSEDDIERLMSKDALKDQDELME